MTAAELPAEDTPVGRWRPRLGLDPTGTVQLPRPARTDRGDGFPTDRWTGLVRFAPAGVRELRRRVRAYRSEHEDHWMLDTHRRREDTEKLKADRARIHADLAARRAEVRAWTAGAIVVLFVVVTVALIVATWWALAALTVAAAAAAFALGKVGRDAAREAAPVVPSLASSAEPSAAELAVDSLTATFRTAEVIKPAEALEVGPAVGMHGNGWAVTVKLPPTTSAADAVKRRTKIATAFDTVDPLVIMTPGGGSNRNLWLWRCQRDPLTGPSPRSPLATLRTPVNVWDGIPFGTTIHGEPVKVAIVGNHLLVVGTTGAGKSQSYGLIPLAYALDPHAQQIILDAEGVGAWAPYERVAKVIQGSTPDKLLEMAEALRWVVDEELPRRQDALARIRRETPKRVPKNEVDESLARDHETGLPPLLVTVEECISLFRAEDVVTRDMAVHYGSEIMRRGRKYGIGMGLLSQKSTADLMPKAISLFATTRFMLSCYGAPTMADSCIPGWRDKGMDPLTLKPARPNRPGSGNPGAGYLEGVGLVEPEADWVLLRTDYADGNDLADQIEFAYDLRRQVRPELLPDGPAAADAAILADLLAVFAEAGHEALSSGLLRAGLGRVRPDRWADMPDRGEGSLNALLAPFGLRLHAIDCATEDGWRRTSGLTRAEVASANEHH